MLSKIGFKERGSEKILSVEEVDQERIRFFLLNRASDNRMHVDITAEEARLLQSLLSEFLGDNAPEDGEPMLSAGEWEELASVQRDDIYAMKDRMVRHLNAEVEALYKWHPELKIEYRFQVEAVRR